MRRQSKRHFGIWHRFTAVLHLALLGVLFWLAADADAHRRFHNHDHGGVSAYHEHDGAACGGPSHEGHHGWDGVTEEEAGDHSGESGAEADDCAVTLLQQGKWAVDPAPDFGAVPLPEVRASVAGFAPSTVLRARTDARLPFSCGPPA